MYTVLYKLLTVAAFLALAAAATAHVPSPEECMDALEDVGVASLTSSLAPCAAGTSERCCDSLNDLLGEKSDAPFALCLCNEEVLDVVISEIEGNPLAKAVGFDGGALIEILQECETPHFTTAACPTPISIDVETKGVTVKMVGAVDVEPEIIDVIDDVVDAIEPATEEIIFVVEEEEAESEGEVAPKSHLRSMLSAQQEKGPQKSASGYYRKAAERVRAYELREPEDSETVENAQKKVDLILKNLRNAREIFADGVRGKKQALVDHASSPPAWTDDGYAGEDHDMVIRNGEVMELVGYGPLNPDMPLRLP